MEEALFDAPLNREFAQLHESAILGFRQGLEEHKLVEKILTTVTELFSPKGLLHKLAQRSIRL